MFLKKCDSGVPLHIHVRSLTVLLKGGGGAAEQERGERNPGETRFDTSNDPHGDRICGQDR